MSSPNLKGILKSTKKYPKNIFKNIIVKKNKYTYGNVFFTSLFTIYAHIFMFFDFTGFKCSDYVLNFLSKTKDFTLAIFGFLLIFSIFIKNSADSIIINEGLQK